VGAPCLAIFDRAVETDIVEIVRVLHERTERSEQGGVDQVSSGGHSR
jgi:hypothetical protein